MSSETGTARSARVTRETRETAVEVAVSLDAAGVGEPPSEPRTETRIDDGIDTGIDTRIDTRIDTGIAFFDHMLDALRKHGGFALELRCEGDLDVDDHHSVEDCALALGQCVDRALGARRGIARFGYAYAPLDEALVRAVLDLSGRPSAHIALPLRRERIGAMSCENVPHFFRSFATSLRATLHLDVIRGENEHHIVEASFKACALALRQAVARVPGDAAPSTKGVL